MAKGLSPGSASTGPCSFPSLSLSPLPVNGAWQVSEGPCHFSPGCVFSTLPLGLMLQRLRLWEVRLTAAEVEPRALMGFVFTQAGPIKRLKRN